MLKKHLQFKGFSMIEALVAITVLTIGVIGPLTLLAGAIANANYARNQITAFFLAQEGQELVINHRNNNRLDGEHIDPNRDDDNKYWLGGNSFGLCIDRNGGGSNIDFCDIDPTVVDQASQIIDCDPSAGCPLTISTDGFYTHQVEDADHIKTIFNRKIQVIPLTLPNGDEYAAQVSVTVSWQEKNLSRNFTLQSIIYR